MGKPFNSKDAKRKHNKNKNNNNNDTAAAIIDERFAAAHNRPQFRVSAAQRSSANDLINPGSTTTSSNNNKIVLDDRFKSILTDERFQLHEKDKYGRKNKKKTNKKKNQQGEEKNSELGAFYTTQEEVDQEQRKKKGDDDDNNKDDDEASTAPSASSGDDSHDDDENKKKNKADSSSDNEETEDPASRIAYLTALSRGELNVSSSSDSDDDDDDDGSSDDDSSDDNDNDDDDSSSASVEKRRNRKIGILDPSSKHQEEVEITHDESRYLAVTNLDWSHMRAIDVFAILSSFTPPGAVKRVQVFVSDFGKEKLALELTKGPGALWKKDKTNKKQREEESDGDDDDDNIDESDDDSHKSKQNTDDDSDGGISAQALEDMDEEAYAEFIQKANQRQAENDFDAEKLREYEASKLKYYFAVAEFNSPEQADICYKEVDGMEFEHSSAAVDMRAIPEDAVASVVEGREMRDEATSIPGNYVPPDYVVSALQQTNVQCTWEAGDTERERVLTKYSSAEQWSAMAENDDLKAYLASDNSSDEEESEDEEEKGSKMRKLLGLDSDSDNEGSDAEGNKTVTLSSTKKKDDESDENQEFSKEISFVPGQAGLQDKIRSKLETKKKSEENQEDLTPWEKYQQKRKEKRREKRQAERRKRGDIEKEETMASKSKCDRKKFDTAAKGDGFFMDGSHSGSDDAYHNEEEEESAKVNPSKEELELLLAGDNDEEVARDFDMRGIHRLEKNKNKKLRGSRKRKEEKLVAGLSGKEFSLDLKDDRFAAVLEGNDGRFGIDRTDPQYKETQAMRDILDEQKNRRKKKRKQKNSTESQQLKQQKVVPPDVVEDSGSHSAGSNALSSLVKNLKSKVASNKAQ